MARISVIVPCYNSSAFLGRTVSSVLSQDMKEWELILVDDGSTDSTPEIIQDFCSRDPRICSVRQENGGRKPAILALSRVRRTRSISFFWIVTTSLFQTL